jgi:hypothetical protein
MESILWALDIVGVIVLCRWALAQDKKDSVKNDSVKRQGKSDSHA